MRMKWINCLLKPPDPMIKFELVPNLIFANYYLFRVHFLICFSCEWAPLARGLFSRASENDYGAQPQPPTQDSCVHKLGNTVQKLNTVEKYTSLVSNCNAIVLQVRKTNQGQLCSQVCKTGMFFNVQCKAPGPIAPGTLSYCTFNDAVGSVTIAYLPWIVSSTAIHMSALDFILYHHIAIHIGELYSIYCNPFSHISMHSCTSNCIVFHCIA